MRCMLILGTGRIMGLGDRLELPGLALYPGEDGNTLMSRLVNPTIFSHSHDIVVRQFLS